MVVLLKIEIIQIHHISKAYVLFRFVSRSVLTASMTTFAADIIVQGVRKRPGTTSQPQNII